MPKELFTVPVSTLPDPRLIERAAKLLIEAKQPFMLVGQEVWRSDAYDEVVKLAEQVGMQVASRNWALIEAVSVPGDVARLNPTDLSIVANVRETARALNEAVASGLTASARARAQDRAQQSQAFNQKLRDGRVQMLADHLASVPIAWERVAQEANRVLEPDAIITHEFNSAMPRVLPWFEFGRGRKELFGSNNGSGLGWLVGAAVRRGRPGFPAIRSQRPGATPGIVVG